MPLARQKWRVFEGIAFSPSKNHGVSGRAERGSISSARQTVAGRHNGAMPRRKPARPGRRLPNSAPRRPSHRSHWRADGAPKTAYRNQSDALSVADERHIDAGVELNVYQCEFCSAWHIGSAAGSRGLTAQRRDGLDDLKAESQMLRSMDAPSTRSAAAWLNSGPGGTRSTVAPVGAGRRPSRPRSRSDRHDDR